MRAASSIGRVLPIAMMKRSFSSLGQAMLQPLIRSTWMVTVAAISTATPHSSPSPWVPWQSPR